MWCIASSHDARHFENTTHGWRSLWNFTIIFSYLVLPFSFQEYILLTPAICNNEPLLLLQRLSIHSTSRLSVMACCCGKVVCHRFPVVHTSPYIITCLCSFNPMSVRRVIRPGNIIRSAQKPLRVLWSVIHSLTHSLTQWSRLHTLHVITSATLKGRLQQQPTFYTVPWFY